ncbi:CHAT domain-containing protein [Annulohypoxylon nitens]|nr:CHAT domain-containing protein [Annulohypoxylon nitens]
MPEDHLSSFNTEQTSSFEYQDSEQTALSFTRAGIQRSQKYHASQQDDDLQEAVLLCEEGLKRASDEHPKKPYISHALARRLLERYKRHNDPLDLEKATQLGQDALHKVRFDDVDRPMIMNGVSQILTVRYETSLEVGYLIEAIDLARRAIKDSPGDMGRCLAYMTGLASNLDLLYKATNNEEHLVESIEWKTRSVDMTEDSSPQKPARLCNLGNARHQRYMLSYDITDLEQSLECHKQASILIQESTDQINWANIMNSYSSRLFSHFQRTRNKATLNESMIRIQEVVDKVPQNHPKWGQYANNLCNKFLERYEEDGNSSDLQMASELAEVAYSHSLEIHNQVLKAVVLGTICTTIRARYGITGALEDLEAAVSKAKEAAEIIPEDHTEYSSVMHSKALAFSLRFNRLNQGIDLETAIRSANSAVKGSRRDYKATAYSTLGTLYGTRWEHMGRDLEDLDLAIQCCRKSLDSGSRTFATLTNLANWLTSRFHVSPESDSYNKIPLKSKYINESIILAKKAFEMTEAVPFHPDRAKVALTLADALQARHKNDQACGGKSLEDLHRSKEVFDTMIANDKTSLPFDRIKIALSRSEIAFEEHHWEDLYRATSSAVELLPFLSPRCVDQSDQQYSLSRFAGLASRAAAAALCTQHNASEALQLLEQGRCIISSSRSDQRVNISHLRNTHGVLAQRFEDLCFVLEQRHVQETGSGSSLSQRHRANSDLLSLIKEIRGKPGFEDFLIPSDPRKMLSNRKKNAVVVINVSFRSDAFIITEKEINVLPLLEVTDESIKKRADDFAKKFSSKSLSGVYDDLEWLWDMIVGPILEFIGMSEPNQRDHWPHICWVPTGSLSHLPLHAAGYHLDNSRRTTMDCVVSSYSTSLKSLQNAADNVKSYHPPDLEQQRAFIVSMAKTPDMQDLRSASREAKAVGKLLQPHICINEASMAKQSYMISELQHCTMFHFAGHGKSDTVDPLQSSLIVADGLITVENLIGLNLNQNPPLLAYLSACLTGNIKVERLLDEGIHLAASFLAAGFQNVIGSLWKVGDDDSARIAEMVYKYLVEFHLTSESVPLALHHALRKMREPSLSGVERGFFRGRSSTSKTIQPQINSYSWISYIHLGFGGG